MKKIIAMLLGLSLLLSLLAACGSSETEASSSAASAEEASSGEAAVSEAAPTATEAPEETPSVQEADSVASAEEEAAEATSWPVEVQLPLTEETENLTFWYSGFPNWDFDVVFGENPAILQAEEMTGVHAELTIVTMDSYSEKFNLMIATGEYPDLISTGDYVGGYAQAVNDEVIIDVTDLMETYANNYMALIGQDEVTLKSAYSDDGCLYGFSSIYVEAELPGTGPIIRQDWLDKLGMDLPETYEEYEEMFAAFQSELGAEEPYILNSTGVDEAMLAGFDISTSFYVVDGEVRAAYNAPEMKEYIEMIREWYEKGYVSKFFTNNPESMPEESSILGETAGCWFSGYQFTDYEEKAASEDYQLVGAAFPVKNSGDTIHTSYQAKRLDGNNMFSVTSCCENPELAVKWLDFWYSEEGYLLANYGVEDLSYTMVDGEPKMTELMTNNPDGLDVRAAIMYYTVQLNTPYYKDSNNLNSAYTERELSAREVWASNQDGAYVIPSAASFNNEEADAYQLHITDVETFADENLLKFITGERPMEEWDDYVAAFDSLGLDVCIDAYQSCYDRFINR